jgi:hypothetical protein
VFERHKEYKGKQAEGKGNAGVFLPYLARLQQRGEAPSNIVKRTAAATKGRQRGKNIMNYNDLEVVTVARMEILPSKAHESTSRLC